MSDEGKAREALDRAARAAALLRDPLLGEAFQAIEARLMDGWKESKADDWKGREQIFAYLKTLSSVKVWLETVVQGGALAARDLKLFEEQARQ